MRKILFLILILFFHSQIFAQHISGKEGAVSIKEKKLSKDVARSLLKMNIFAPLLGYSQLSLEKTMARSRRIELGLGIIGAGRNLHIQPRSLGISLDRFQPYFYRPGHKNQFGGFFEFGYKFIRRNHFNGMTSNNDNSNTFEGSYIRPSILAGAYSFHVFRDDSTTATTKKHHRFGALLLNLGHQWALGRKAVFEFYMGGGAEIDNVKDDGNGLYGHPFVLAVAKDNPTVNFAFTAGFRFGLLLKN